LLKDKFLNVPDTTHHPSPTGFTKLNTIIICLKHSAVELWDSSELQIYFVHRTFTYFFTKAYFFTY